MNTANSRGHQNGLLAVLGLLTCTTVFMVYVKATVQTPNAEDPRLQEYEKPGVCFSNRKIDHSITIIR